MGGGQIVAPLGPSERLARHRCHQPRADNRRWVTMRTERVERVPGHGQGILVAPLGDQQTTFRLVSLTGQTEANASVSLVGGAPAAAAGADGVFRINNVVLSLGSNSLTLQATDLAGNYSGATRALTRISPPAASNTSRATS